MSDEEIRKLAAIMFTDMVGYSALSQRDEKLAQELLEEHRRLLREIFPRFNGTEIKTIGDAFLVEFGSALEAAQCAIEIQRTLAHRDADAPADRQIQVRIGVHIGDVVHRGGDVYGDGVNIASRIEPIAGPGGICVSMDVERQIRNALEARFEKLAPTDLKNISVPMDLFRIVLPWETKPAPSKSEIRLRQSGSDKSETGARSRRVFATSFVIILLLAGLLGYQLWRTRNQAAPSKPSGVGEVPVKSIAVLPFENLSEEKANAFFADGVQDQILTDLSQIADLKVISRTSVMQYKSGVARNLREISQQLGVAHVVEGSVQRAANKVRVNAQLIDARNDTHLWAQTYDRDLADVFAIQSEIAKAIAEQLQAKLSPAEKSAIEQRPTSDLTAFDQYTRARTLLLTTSLNISGDKSLLQAIELLNSAVARDGSFHAAFCQLVNAHDQLYAVYADHTPERLAAAETALQRATELRPEAAETHLVRGSHLYFAFRNYKQALSELQTAGAGLPNDPRIPELTGYILRRQGKPQEGLHALEKAVALDPRNASIISQLALSYQNLRRYAEEKVTLERALEITPDDVGLAGNLAAVDLLWHADTASIHQFIDRVRAERPSVLGDAANFWFIGALADRDWMAVCVSAEHRRGSLPVKAGDGLGCGRRG